MFSLILCLQANVDHGKYGQARLAGMFNPLSAAGLAKLDWQACVNTPANVDHGKYGQTRLAGMFKHTS